MDLRLLSLGASQTHVLLPLGNSLTNMWNNLSCGLLCVVALALLCGGKDRSQSIDSKHKDLLRVKLSVKIIQPVMKSVVVGLSQL